MDENYGSVMWTNQFAIQGFRIGVPDVEAADARSYFSSLRPPRVRRPRETVGRHGWRALAVLLTFTLGAGYGWLAVGGLRRHSPGYMVDVLQGAGLVMAAVAGPIILGAILGYFGVLAPILVLVVGLLVVRTLERRRLRGAA